MSLLEYSFPFHLIAHSHSLLPEQHLYRSASKPAARISYYTITDYIHMFTLVSERIRVSPFLLLWRDLFVFPLSFETFTTRCPEWRAHEAVSWNVYTIAMSAFHRININLAAYPQSVLHALPHYSVPSVCDYVCVPTPPVATSHPHTRTRAHPISPVTPSYIHSYPPDGRFAFASRRTNERKHQIFRRRKWRNLLLNFKSFRVHFGGIQGAGACAWWLQVHSTNKHTLFTRMLK